jgi:hypothetical protein
MKAELIWQRLKKKYKIDEKYKREFVSFFKEQIKEDKSFMIIEAYNFDTGLFGKAYDKYWNYKSAYENYFENEGGENVIILSLKTGRTVNYP